MRVSVTMCVWHASSTCGSCDVIGYVIAGAVGAYTQCRHITPKDTSPKAAYSDPPRP